MSGEVAAIAPSSRVVSPTTTGKSRKGLPAISVRQTISEAARSRREKGRPRSASAISSAGGAGPYRVGLLRGQIDSKATPVPICTGLATMRPRSGGQQVPTRAVLTPVGEATKISKDLAIKVTGRKRQGGSPRGGGLRTTAARGRTTSIAVSVFRISTKISGGPYSRTAPESRQACLTPTHEMRPCAIMSSCLIAAASSRPAANGAITRRREITSPTSTRRETRAEIAVVATRTTSAARGQRL